ncbi:MAG: hypothetical protein AAGC68_09390 [Verrucomicrobiota bacterium]
MAIPNSTLIEALREAADRISAGARYEWGHLARCNCGHLVQSLTRMTDVQISQAVDHQLDEWTEHAKAFCPNSGRSVDDLFLTLEKSGMSRKDVIHLENLTDPRVLSRIGANVRLRKNQREDVVLYMNAFADLLEEESGIAPSPTATRRPVVERTFLDVSISLPTLSRR